MFERLALRQKLFGAFGAVLVLLAGVGWLSFAAVGGLDQSAVDLQRTSAINGELDRFIGSLYAADSAAYAYALSGDRAALDELAEAGEGARVHLAEVGELTQIEAVQAFVATTTPRTESHLDLLDDVVEARRDGGVAVAVALGESGEVTDSLHEIVDDYRELMVTRDGLMSQRRDDANAFAARGRLQIGVGLALAIAAGLGLAWALTRQVGGQVGGATQRIGTAAEGLASVSTQMSSTAEETASQANVVAAAGEQVSQNVATVATAMEEMGATVPEIARSADAASSVSAAAVSSAAEADRIVA